MASIQQEPLMLEYHPLQVEQVAPSRVAKLLQEFQQILAEQGMASIDEYGDMLRWTLPTKDGFTRYFHVFHPGFCSYEDTHYGTVHFHGGIIRGILLAGEMDHWTYEATVDENGPRSYDGVRYALKRHEVQQKPGDQYTLQPHVPHWVVPRGLAITYFEEEDNGELGDLVNLDTQVTDNFGMEQEDVEAMRGAVERLVVEQLEAISRSVVH